MSVFIAIAVAVTVAVPLWYAWRLWGLDEPSRAATLLAMAEAAAVFALVLLLGRWDIAGLHTRWILLALFLAALLRVSLRLARTPRGTAPVRSRAWSWWRCSPRRSATSCSACGRPTRWHSPSPCGTGPSWSGRAAATGCSTIMPAMPRSAARRHHRRRPRRVPRRRPAARGYGTLRHLARARRQPLRRRGHGHPGRPPRPRPPEADPEHPAGNHVVLDCGEVTVELAHLMQGSVAGAAGDTVAPGDPLGRVGNSGNTTEPHLHIHAVDPGTGQGVPMALESRAPLRNRVYRR